MKWLYWLTLFSSGSGSGLNYCECNNSRQNICTLATRNLCYAARLSSLSVSERIEKASHCSASKFFRMFLDIFERTYVCVCTYVCVLKITEQTKSNLVFFSLFLLFKLLGVIFYLFSKCFKFLARCTITLSVKEIDMHR